MGRGESEQGSKISLLSGQLAKVKSLSRKKQVLLTGSISLLVVLVIFFFCLPNPLFNKPSSTVLEDRSGNLIQAQIASDGQWRFPYNNQVPEKFKQSIIQYEDRYFYKHIGINPYSIYRAVKLNIKARRVVAGGSTISMQVIRLVRNGKSRTFKEKLIDIFCALRLEIGYSKNEILSLYVSHAPFGGNVVGLDAASWRYFGRPAKLLSWAESATLAVLPNSPALIYPGKNRDALLRKRDRLLKSLYLSGKIDRTTYNLSLTEPLPLKPFPLPQLAPQLLARVINDHQMGKQVITSLDANLQKQVMRIIAYHHNYLKENKINNAAALVLDVETGRTLCYVGNVDEPNKKAEGYDVDIITSARSTGSILKPFLYAAMLQDGLILPNTLIPDIPTQIAGYTPKNYNEGYDGAVPQGYRIKNLAVYQDIRDSTLHLI
jgi:penicillin-binding protein 1C